MFKTENTAIINGDNVTIVIWCHGVTNQVHVRHNPYMAVAVVCGVAVREGNLILAADMCLDGRLHYLKFNTGSLSNGAGITTNNMGYAFKVSVQ